MKKTIKNIVQERDVRYLVHFTRAENLESIFLHGIISVAEIDAMRLKVNKNDDLRLDYCTEAVCLSIGFPNYKMFYGTRRENPDSDWVVLIIEPEVLYDLDCAFCKTNAASLSVSSVPLKKRKTVEAFEEMFYEPLSNSRKKRNLPDDFPTDPQAEVLVLEAVPPEYIVAVCFEDKEAEQENLRILPHDIESTHKSNLFSWRIDCEYWR
ncbi:MAG: DUF4433 domain-containing protein [Oscillospiraceae bacterium]|nr:DUF4433 domain-containing protein [Oscillospiraceae bacterium]